MGKQLVVLCEHGRKKIGLFQDGRLENLHIEEEGEATVGNIYCGQVTSFLPSIPGAFVDFGGKRDGFLPLEGEPLYRIKKKWRAAVVVPYERKERIREGDKVLVQITKEAMEEKGCRLSTDVSLPGRHLVYMPISNRGGISKQIDDGHERNRLKGIIRDLEAKHPGAIIARTVAEGADSKEFHQDMKSLFAVWKDLCKEFLKSDVPRLLHEELNLLERILRDTFSPDFEQIVINSRKIRLELTPYLDSFESGMAIEKMIRYRTASQISEEFKIDKHIRDALARKVWLRCGGYLFIDELPTLTVIDVNTGKNVRRSDPRKTILETNVEAAKEIARQLRLRDIGGIIVIDFIDMLSKADQKKVLETLQEAMTGDRMAWDVGRFSENGIVQITRKRGRHSLLNLMTEECSHCNGEGRIPKV
jgi:ribonuclease G